MTRTTTPTSGSRRTTAITAASIGAVGLAGLFAVGANLGILTSTDRSNVGTASVVAEPTTTARPVDESGVVAGPTRSDADRRLGDDEHGDDERYEGGDDDD